jgi:hypothetical protein
MTSDPKEGTSDKILVEKEIQSQIEAVKDFLNSDSNYPFSELRNEYIDPVERMNEYIRRALNYNPETGEIDDDVTTVQWIENDRAQAVIRSIGLGIGDLERKRDRCKGNIQRFNMDFMDDEPVVFIIE